MHNESQLRINSANKAYFAMYKILSSRLLSIDTKEALYILFYLILGELSKVLQETC